jgi:hypothetical protein
LHEKLTGAIKSVQKEMDRWKKGAIKVVEAADKSILLLQKQMFQSIDLRISINSGTHYAELRVSAGAKKTDFHGQPPLSRMPVRPFPVLYIPQ